MGGKSSRDSDGSRRNVSSYGSGGSSSSWDNYGYGGYPPSQSPRPHHHHASASGPFHDYGQPKRKLDRRYSRISDNYRSLDEVITN